MEPTDDYIEEKSKSQLKREADALQKIGEQLINMSAHELEDIPLPDNLVSAIEDARQMKKGALKRQRQFIGKLMRDLDPEPIIDALEARKAKALEQNRNFHRLEAWRDRLLDEADAALNEFLDDYPAADRQKLRQLIRQAKKEAEQGKPPKSARNLFRYLRELSEQ
ncbi:MAG: ribosome biogenesis factor YjgA [Gammaproteobacteria bacterium]|nr:ribosome biogenesis factor YjgA [Gammaproteobacteria bacterium]